MIKQYCTSLFIYFLFVQQPIYCFKFNPLHLPLLLLHIVHTITPIAIKEKMHMLYNRSKIEKSVSKATKKSKELDVILEVIIPSIKKKSTPKEQANMRLQRVLFHENIQYTLNKLEEKSFQEPVQFTPFAEEIDALINDSFIRLINCLQKDLDEHHLSPANHNTCFKEAIQNNDTNQ